MKNYLDKQQKLILKLSFVFVIVLLIIALIIFFNKDKVEKKVQFVVPEKEQNVILGKPNNIEKNCMYQNVKVNDKYSVHLCGIPLLKDNNLTIYFTSDETNVGQMKIKVLDLDSNIIGESGIISPDSYIKDIKLNKNLKDKEKITVKVMNYEDETYYSLGSIKLDLTVTKIS